MYQAAVLLLVCALTGVRGYGTGAPSSACTTMRPGHTGTSPQTGPSPYTISTSAISYQAGTPISVRVTSTDSRAFQGLLVQARVKGTTTIVGTWSSTGLPAATKLTSCSGADNSWTHSSTQNKQDITHRWNPPASDQGQIEFVATVLETKAVYWMNHKTAALSYHAGGAGDMTTAEGDGTSAGNTVTSTNSPSTDSNTAAGGVSSTSCTSCTGTGASTLHISGVLILAIAFLWKMIV